MAVGWGRIQLNRTGGIKAPREELRRFERWKLGGATERACVRKAHRAALRSHVSETSTDTLRLQLALALSFSLVNIDRDQAS